MMGFSLLARLWAVLVFAGLLCGPGPAVQAEKAREEGGFGVVEPDLLEVIYAGYEELRYDISWTGGIKIGELRLRVERINPEEEVYRIIAKVSDYGLFRLFYPVNDTFLTDVQGVERLPFLYRVHQLEGHGKSETNRLTRYDQQGLQVRYRRDREPEEVIDVSGPVHNEFSSFFAMRAMRLQPGESFIVPTFTDHKRHEVRVRVLGRERLDSLYGPVETIRVLPEMKFRGLYDKTGDTVIWFTDDECRVPVRINSKILIGSLTATLVSHINPFCDRYSMKE